MILLLFSSPVFSEIIIKCVKELSLLLETLPAKNIRRRPRRLLLRYHIICPHQARDRPATVLLATDSMSLGISGVCPRLSTNSQFFQDKWGNLCHALQMVSGNERCKRRCYGSSPKSKNSGERGGKPKGGTLAFVPHTQSRELWWGCQVLLLQAVELTRSNSRAKLRATFCEQGRVDGLIFGGSRPTGNSWTDSAEEAMLTGGRPSWWLKKRCPLRLWFCGGPK